MGFPQYDFLVIGAGFFGCRVACYLKRHFGGSVAIIEREPEILQRASFVNQARVHNGYHYPRSVLTALRSVENFPAFTKEFEYCIVDDFKKLYAIAANNSKVTAQQFEHFFKRIGSPVDRASKIYRKMFSSDLIEEVFETKEYAFDARKLAELTNSLIEDLGVSLHTGYEVQSVDCEDSIFKIGFSTNEGEEGFLRGRFVFNCTYANLNNILDKAGLERVRLKYEYTELALVKPPEQLKDVGITVMDGPFFSLMPFPAEKLHSFSHVRYTPHTSWTDDTRSVDNTKVVNGIHAHSQYLQMVKDASRYLPLASKCEYEKSIYEIKTVLQASEMNDSRPILFRKDKIHENFFSVLGAKIDNVYDIEKELGLQDFKHV